jgi:hypothetical protein
MKGKGGKKDTNHAYVYMYAREGEKAPNNDGWMDVTLTVAIVV